MKQLPCSTVVRALVVFSSLALRVAPVSGQIVSLRTAPIATGEQYMILPSENVGMGGVGIALRDALGDPFGNPAMGSRLRQTRAFAAPTFYTIGGAEGGGRTLTSGILGSSGHAFGGMTISLQELEDGFSQRFFIATDAPTEVRSETASYLGDNHGNRYFNALGGIRLSNNRTSLGAGVSHASLGSVDGMRQLYANSVRVNQDGGITDYRLGVVHEMNGGWLEATAIHSRVDIMQFVDYQEWISNPSQPPQQQQTLRSWTQTNEDVSRTNGLRGSYVRSLDAPGWKFGVSATVNRKTHPHLPDYDLARLPRDPGVTTAFDVGVGIAKELGGTRFGLDFNFIPARSQTWADSDTAIIAQVNGRTIQPGEHTVDNEFMFANVRMATGVARDGRDGGWQLGFSVVSNAYSLHQDNHVTVRTTRTKESWTEWTPSWGLHHTFGDISLRYSGRLTMKGFPDLGFFGDDKTTSVSAPDSGQDFLVPITGPVFLPEYSIFTNQFSVSVAIGSARR